MNDLLKVLAGTLLNEQTVGNISENLGLNSDQTKNVLGSALPSILNGILRNTNQQGGLDGLFRALVKDHDGSLLDNLGSVLKNPNAAGGAGILEHIFGDNRSSIEHKIGSSNGIDMAKVSRILKIAAPIVLAALGRQRRTQDLNQRGLQEILVDTNNGFRNGAQKETSILEKMLDSNGDGSVMNELTGVGLNILKNVIFGR